LLYTIENTAASISAYKVWLTQKRESATPRRKSRRVA
jgi:hypothetical protein